MLVFVLRLRSSFAIILTRKRKLFALLFTDRSKTVLLLSIINVISVLFSYDLMHACLLMACGHLLGKGLPFGSRLWCLIVMLSLSHCYFGLGMVLDCIEFWSLPPFIFWMSCYCKCPVSVLWVWYFFIILIYFLKYHVFENIVEISVCSISHNAIKIIQNYCLNFLDIFFSMLSKSRKWCHDLKISYGVNG